MEETSKQGAKSAGALGNALAWIKERLPMGADAQSKIGALDHEVRLDEAMDHVERDESAPATNDTAETLAAMRQEVAHSLERDLDDPFFWSEGRPDAVAGMAKLYLRSRCPTPYWRALAGASQYGLWGAVAMGRALARLRREDPGLGTLASFAFEPLSQQSKLLNEAIEAGMGREAMAELALADGLPLAHGPAFMPEIHFQSAMRALFCAVAMDRSIDWPDPPPRLGIDASIPDELPCLWIDLASMGAKLDSIDAGSAMDFWLSSQAKDSSLLLVPDWASWMLGSKAWPSAPKWQGS